MSRASSRWLNETLSGTGKPSSVSFFEIAWRTL